MDIVLTQGSTEIILPVLPESYQVRSAQKNTTANVNAIGEVNLLGWPDLDTIEWSSFFPSKVQSYTRSQILDPYEYVSQISRMKAAGPLDLHLLDMMAIHCTIETFSWGEVDGTGDVDYSIGLKRYIYINSEGVVNKYLFNGGQGRPSPEKPRSGKTYTTKAEDNLLAIARRELGISDWTRIYALNRAIIGPDPTIIKPGLRLVMPE